MARIGQKELGRPELMDLPQRSPATEVLVVVCRAEGPIRPKSVVARLLERGIKMGLEEASEALEELVERKKIRRAGEAFRAFTDRYKGDEWLD